MKECWEVFTNRDTEWHDPRTGKWKVIPRGTIVREVTWPELQNLPSSEARELRVIRDKSPKGTKGEVILVWLDGRPRAIDRGSLSKRKRQ